MTPLLNPRRASQQFLCTLLAALMALGPVPAIADEELIADPAKPKTAAQEVQPGDVDQDVPLIADPAKPKPADLSYVVPNPCVLIALRPAQLLNAPVAEMMPTEVLQAAALQQIGVDPLAAEQVVLSAGVPTNGPPPISLLARFNAAVELKPDTGFTAHTEASDLKGKPYLKSRQPMAPSFYSLDEKSILIATDQFIQGAVSRQAAPPVDPLVATFAAADQGDDLLAMVDVASVRHLIAMGLAQAPLPPELNALRELPNLVKTVEVRANLSRPAPSDLIVTANNEADARKIITVFDGIKQQMAANIVRKAQEALASEDPVEQANARYSIRMARLMDERVQLEREADQIVLFRADLTGADGNAMAATAAIGTLVALLLPAVQAAREAARRNSSMNNLKQIMLGLLNHESARGALPAQANFDKTGKPLLSWRVHILPYMEQVELYRKFRLDEPWDSEHNKALIPLMPQVYAHPGSKLNPAEGKTNYLGVQGKDHMFSGKPEGRRLRDIEDGTSNTITIVQATDERAVTWTKPEDFETGKDDPNQGLGGLAGDIFLAAFCDGSVRAVSKQVDPAALRALFTVSGGEAVPLNGF
jgi:hypothetical protein